MSFKRKHRHKRRHQPTAARRRQCANCTLKFDYADIVIKPVGVLCLNCSKTLELFDRVFAGAEEIRDHKFFELHADGAALAAHRLGWTLEKSAEERRREKIEKCLAKHNYYLHGDALPYPFDFSGFPSPATMIFDPDRMSEPQLAIDYLFSPGQSMGKSEIINLMHPPAMGAPIVLQPPGVCVPILPPAPIMHEAEHLLPPRREIVDKLEAIREHFRNALPLDKHPDFSGGMMYVGFDAAGGEDFTAKAIVNEKGEVVEFMRDPDAPDGEAYILPNYQPATCPKCGADNNYQSCWCFGKSLSREPVHPPEFSNLGDVARLMKLNAECYERFVESNADEKLPAQMYRKISVFMRNCDTKTFVEAQEHAEFIFRAHIREAGEDYQRDLNEWFQGLTWRADIFPKQPHKHHGEDENCELCAKFFASAVCDGCGEIFTPVESVSAWKVLHFSHRLLKNLK